MLTFKNHLSSSRVVEPYEHKTEAKKTNKKLVTKLKCKKCVRRGKVEKCLGKNVDKQFEHIETRLGKQNSPEHISAKRCEGKKEKFSKVYLQKKITTESVGQLLHRAGDLMIKDIEKAEVINAYLTSLLSRAAIRNTRSVWSMQDSA